MKKIGPLIRWLSSFSYEIQVVVAIVFAIAGAAIGGWSLVQGSDGSVGLAWVLAGIGLFIAVLADASSTRSSLETRQQIENLERKIDRLLEATAINDDGLGQGESRPDKR